MRKQKEAAIVWMKKKAESVAPEETVETLWPEGDSAVLLDALAKFAALEDAANAVTDLHGHRKASTEDFVKTLKSIYRSQFLELQRRDLAAANLRR